MFMPFNVLGLWFRALLSLVLIAGGLTLLGLWYNNREHVVFEPANDGGVATQTRSTMHS